MLATTMIQEGLLYWMGYDMPDITPHREVAVPPIAPRSNTRLARILVMDEEALLCRVIAQMLGELGYEVATTQDGHAAVELYTEAFANGQSFTAVILDLTVRTGYGACHILPHLQALDPQVQVIVASGYTYDPIIIQYQDYGFCGALAKPFTMQELATVMQGVTGIIWSPVIYAYTPKKVGNITL
jgi:CheY-like chemotaxis protein